jgi:hypothetical protein
VSAWASFTAWWLSLTEAFRERRRLRLGPASEATYDAYPNRRNPAEFRLFWQTRGPGGRFIVEEVDLSAYDFDRVPYVLLEPEACSVFVGHIITASNRLKRRRDAERLRATRGK